MVCVMEWILNSKNYSSRVIMAVFVVALGVGVCTVTDVEVNLKGFICAAVAVFCTSLQQIVSIKTSVSLHKTEAYEFSGIFCFRTGGPATVNLFTLHTPSPINWHFPH